MTDHDALVRAICAHPDDDTPRLVYADFLDDLGEPDRAAFVRAQIELARTPAWEPFAVLCRHRKVEWSEKGMPFRPTLPRLPERWNVEWHEQPFRRGFGWRLRVGSLFAWQELATELFGIAPIGELHLRAAATLDDWRRFAAGEWLRFVRAVHFEGGSPVEPVRALCAAPAAAGITDLSFHISTSPGLPILVTDLLKGWPGAAIRNLHFRMGEFAWLEDLVDALTPDGPRLSQLSMEVMGLTPDLIHRWCGRAGPTELLALDLQDNYGLGNAGIRALADGLREEGGELHSLGLAGAGMTDDGAKVLAGCTGLTGIRMLDLQRNGFTPAGVRALAASETLAGIRSLNLRMCRIGDQALRRLTRARFWPNLVELDLRNNPISNPGAKHLLRAPDAPDLTALLLDGSRLGADARNSLRRHFGDRVILGEV